MSQAGDISAISGPVPPVVATSYVTQDGTAVPAANVLIVNGFDSTETNDNGIITKGGVVGTGTANEVDVVLTNRLFGTATTTDATPTTVITFPMTAGSTATFDGMVVAIEASLGDGIGGQIIGTINRSGGGAVIINTPDKIVNASAAISTANFDISVSGNNAIFTVTGVAGKTIEWKYLVNYIFISFI